MTKRIMLQPSPPSSGSIGSTLKYIGIGRILRSKGCEVSFVIGGKLKQLVEKEGFTCYDFPVPMAKGTQQDINSIVDFIRWTGMIDDDFAEKSVQSEIEAIKDFKPDVIFSEARLSSVISAKTNKIPIMSVAAWPCHPDFPENIQEYGKHIEVYNRIIERYGLEKINHLAELIFMRSDVKISPSIPELEPELSKISDVNFMGYILDIDFDEGYSKTEERDIILVYFSVGAINPKLYYDVILKTFCDSRENVIVACGYHYELSEELTCPLKNVQFVPYINLSKIIHRIKLIIFHGGQDTMMLSLLYGIPSITIPGKHFERKYNSSALQMLGVSEQLPVYGFRPSRLKKAISQSYTHERREKCLHWRRMLKKYNGTQACADYLISFCER